MNDTVIIKGVVYTVEVRSGVDVDLTTLHPDQRVRSGNGIDAHELLTPIKYKNDHHAGLICPDMRLDELVGAERVFKSLKEKKNIYNAGWKAASKYYDDMFKQAEMEDAALMVRACVLVTYGDNK